MEQSVIGRWCPSKFGRTGTQLYDLSGYNNTGTLTNMDPATDWTDEGLDFDGSNDSVRCSPTTSLAVSQMSTTFWVNLRSSATSAVIGQWADNNFVFVVNLSRFADYDVGIFSNSGNLFPNAFTTGNAIPQSKWANVGIVYDGTQSSNTNRIRIYIDGNRQTGLLFNQTSSGNFPSTLPSLSVPIWIGAQQNSTTRTVNGQLDDITIYHTALTDDEFQQVYHAGPGAGLVPYRRHRKRWVRGVSYKPVYRRRTKKVGNIYQDKAWQNLNDNIVGRWCPSVYGKTGTQLYDLSGYNNTGTLTGMDPATDWVEKGLDFDGVNDSVITNNTLTVFPNSVSFWVKSGTQSAGGISIIRPFVSFGKIGLTNAGFYVGTNRGTSTTLRWQVGQNAEKTIANTSINDGNWHHLLVSISSGVFYLFFDGSQLDTQTPGTILSSIFRFGSEFSENRYFAGQLDDICIFNQPFTAGEAMQLYHAGPGAGLSLSPKRSAMMYPPSPPAGGWKPYWLRPSSKIIGAGI